MDQAAIKVARWTKERRKRREEKVFSILPTADAVKIYISRSCYTVYRTHTKGVCKKSQVVLSILLFYNKQTNHSQKFKNL